MYLGIDLGTSGVKALLIDEAGEIIGVAHSSLAVLRPQARWAEQDPDSWWQATCAAIDQLQQHYPAALAALRGIGLSGQMHGATLLDQADRPLRPAILWNDSRSDRQCAALTQQLPTLHKITGNLAMPGFTAPKLLWVAEHEPAVFAQTRTVLLPKDYLRLCLTGDKVSDYSDASGTLWLDVAARDWSDTMLAATGLGRDAMPALVDGSQCTGELRQTLRKRWGIQQAVKVAGGAGDNAASAVGVGAVASGDAFLSLGTSGVIFVVDPSFQPESHAGVHTFCHTLAGRWHRMSVMLSAASCLTWAARLIGASDEAALLQMIAALDNTSRLKAPLFLPYLSGERSPHNDPYAQGVFFGLTHSTEREALAYAVLEGVTFGLADGLQALQSPAATIQSLPLVGGGARSALWAQLIADVLKLPVYTYASGEAGAAQGAARLALLACGASEALVCTKPDSQTEFLPQQARQAALDERLGRYRQLYRALTPLFTSGGSKPGT